MFGKGLTAAALKQLDRENERFKNSSDDDDDDEDDVETMTLASRVSQLSVRNKHESKEEKKARKSALKELRRERRVERKMNRDAFKDEKCKQEKNAINLRMSCNQAIKLLWIIIFSNSVTNFVIFGVKMGNFSLRFKSTFT